MINQRKTTRLINRNVRVKSWTLKKPLINFLAQILDIPRKNIKLLKGESSRHKLIEISGLNEQELGEKLHI